MYKSVVLPNYSFPSMFKYFSHLYFETPKNERGCVLIDILYCYVMSVLGLMLALICSFEA